MRTRPPLFALGVAALAAIAAPPRSSAQCSGNAELWGTDQVITRVHSNTGIGLDFGFFAHGAVLYAIWNESGSVPVAHSAGDFKWVFNAGTLLHEIGHNLTLCHAGAVVTAQGPEALFVASDNGRLYKLDVQTGMAIASVDVRRPGCLADQLIATPAVQLYSASNPAFQSAMIAARGTPDDLVIVITHDGCGDHSANQVIAYYASDLSERWRFNPTGSYSMDSAEDGCEIDYGSNVLYCGTNQAMPGQYTLWSIETLSGGLLWATDAGPIRNRPRTAPGPELEPYVASAGGTIQNRNRSDRALIGPTQELYAVSSDGMIQKRDPSSGALIWAYPTGSPIVRNISPEFRSPNPTRIYCTTTDGLLRGIIDNFPSPVLLWPPFSPGGGIGYTTAPAVAPGLGKGYVGRSDGLLQEIDLGGVAGPVKSAGTAGTVHDPSLDVSSPAAPDTDRLMVSTTEGSVRRYCIPWGATTAVPGSPPKDESFLSQNAPNPFATITRIEYRLPYDARVEVEVYDVEGHRVRALSRDQQPAGSHDVSWNGLDDAGRSVATGTYFYRLRAVGAEGRSFERTKKVQVVR